jgi:catechol 2,3-dioxygenase-like lactoylglutathione lyase family enzyme
MRDAIEKLRLDHLGIQVSDLPAAIEAFSKYFGYRQATQPVVNTRHQVEVVFLEKPGSIGIKLFRSVADNRPQIPKLHHVAFRTDEMDGAVEALVEQGARVLHAPAPGEAFNGAPIAFLFAAGLNFELVSTDERRARLCEPES